MAKEVPFAYLTLPFGPITQLLVPNATASGFTRPSAVKPTELKPLFFLSLSIAPTVKIPPASDGNVIFSQSPLPSLPALQKTSIPLSAAKLAARLIIAVLPSKASWSYDSSSVSKAKYPSDEEITSTPALSAYSTAAVQ